MSLHKVIYNHTDVNWVDIHPNKAREALTWAKEHCPNYITNDVATIKMTEIIPSMHNKGWDSHSIVYRFYFSCRKEQTVFSLKWV
jgi:hypothetical protein